MPHAPPPVRPPAPEAPPIAGSIPSVTEPVFRPLPARIPPAAPKEWVNPRDRAMSRAGANLPRYFPAHRSLPAPATAGPVGYGSIEFSLQTILTNGISAVVAISRGLPHNCRSAFRG